MRPILGLYTLGASPLPPPIPEPPPSDEPSGNITGQVIGQGDRSGLHVRGYDTATGALLLSLTTDAEGRWSGQLDHPDPFTLLITDPSHQHSPTARGPFRVTP